MNGRAEFSEKNGNDDSVRDYQDVEPDLDGAQLMIIDTDGPTTHVSNLAAFKHTRRNFWARVVFYYTETHAERCSETLRWSTSVDIGKDYSDPPKAVFIYDDPNDGDSANEIDKEGHLDSLGNSLPQATLTDAQTAAGNREIERNKDVTVTVTGTKLVGRFFLQKGTTKISAKDVRVKETDTTKHVSDLTEARAVFNVGPQVPSDGWQLTVENTGGTSNAIDGFSVIPEEE